MTVWENKILDTFISHYFSSDFSQQTNEKENRFLRLRTSILFPNFDNAHYDEKNSYLEAAESLERRGIIKLRWEKRKIGEQLGTLNCSDFEALFKEAGKLYPLKETENIKNMLVQKISILKNTQTDLIITENVISLLEYILINFGPREIGMGINLQKTEEYIKLLEYTCNSDKIKNLTIRALSILLYNDSKHLEDLIALFSPILSRAQKNTGLVPNFNFPERSYPDAMISGKIIFEYKEPDTPLINAKGLILNFPLESAEAIAAIKPITENNAKNVLTIENKETFFALGSPGKIAVKATQAVNEKLSLYDCFLYTGGYPNRVAAKLIEILAVSGFNFYHAGDLDPDGILILQHIKDIVNTVCPDKTVTPIRMNVSTFEQYRDFARPLSKSALYQTKKIREETRSIPELADLIKCIEETGMGVEQEIIDYR